MIRIGIVDDHDLVREGIRALLEQDPLFQIVRVCSKVLL